MLKRSALILVLAAFSLAAPDARADDVAKARVLYRQGSQHYDLNEYPQALELFKEAYRNHEDPTFLYNIAQCYRQLGDNESAVRFYRSYINKSSLSPEQLASIRELIKRLESEPQTKRVSPPPPPPPPAPKPAPPPVATTTAPMATAVTASPSPRRRWYRNPAGWSLLAGGVAGVAVAGAGLGIAMNERSQALAATTQAAFDMHHGNSIHDQQWGWPLLGVGSALVVAGVAVLAAKAVHK